MKTALLPRQSGQYGISVDPTIGDLLRSTCGAQLAPDDYMKRAGNWSDSIVINQPTNVINMRAVAKSIIQRTLGEGLQP